MNKNIIESSSELQYCTGCIKKVSFCGFLSNHLEFQRESLDIHPMST